jgi:YbbR domain-containing protein
MAWLRGALLNNWWLKLLSLGLAYALWLVVTQAPPVEIGVSVPLELRHLPSHLQVAGEIPTRVHVHLHGSESRLRLLPAEEIGVVVNLSGATPGSHNFRLRAEDVEVPAGIEVVRIIPEDVELELVPR